MFEQYFLFFNYECITWDLTCTWNIRMHIDFYFIVNDSIWTKLRKTLYNDASREGKHDGLKSQLDNDILSCFQGWKIVANFAIYCFSEIWKGSTVLY